MSDNRKLAVLKFVERNGPLAPRDAAYYRVCPSIRAAYVYLLKLHRQGLLSRTRAARGIVYRISQRGRDRLLYLEGSEKARWR